MFYGFVGSQEPPLTRYRGALMRRDVHFSTAAAERELGHHPEVSWQEGASAGRSAALNARD